MTAFSLSEAQALFKINYYKRSMNLYNSETPTLGRVKKRYDFTGRSRNLPTTKSYQGGIGSGTLPTPNVADYEEASLTRKRVYAVTEIEREAIYAAGNDAGAFIRGTRESVQKTVESFNRNMSRIIFGSSDGSLDRGDGITNVSGTGTTVDPYVVVLNADWKEANFEEKDFINYDAETTNLEITLVTPSTRVINLVGTSTGLAALSGSGPVPTTKYFYMQGSKANDPAGLKASLDATSGSLYGVTVDRKWSATQIAAASAGLSVDLMNETMLGVHKKSGKSPNMIVTSYTQYIKFLNLLEDHKRYTLQPRDKDLRGKVSFTGLEFMSVKGPVPVFFDRFVEDDRMYFLNDNFLEIHHAPGFGWFDDDGTVFLRKASTDNYEARYGGYLEFYIQPTFQGVIDGLST